VSGPLLHLTTPTQWRAALAAGVLAPPSLTDIGYVHLSTPAQVALPADRLFRGRTDLLALMLNPARIGVEIRYEPGVPTDPESMRFPHAYGPVPTHAVTAVVPYRPRPDGGFDAPTVPAPGPAGRLAGFEPSLLRRTATSEIPVTGGVAVLTAPVPESYEHNQLLIDGATGADELAADADRTLGEAGIPHRRALLVGADLAPTAARLAERGWEVEQLVGMAAPAGGEPDRRVEHVDREALRSMWDAEWQRDAPEHCRLEEAVLDVRYLAVRAAGTAVASCLLKIDGGTALLDMIATDPRHRGRGYGDALLSTAGAVAADAGCDLVVLEAAAADWPRHWYTRRGFAEVEQAWTVELTP